MTATEFIEKRAYFMRIEVVLEGLAVVEREDLRLVGQEGDVDLLERLDELGHGVLAQVVEQLLGARLRKVNVAALLTQKARQKNEDHSV